MLPQCEVMRETSRRFFVCVWDGMQENCVTDTISISKRFLRTESGQGPRGGLWFRNFLFIFWMSKSGSVEVCIV